MLFEFFKDAILAAIAAIGFGAISRIPRRAYLFCGLIAAIGHSLRFLLMNPDLGHLHILLATAIASLLIGTLAVFASPLAKTPAEAYLFPSLLPMIPGIYAYKSFGGMVMCLLGESKSQFDYYFYQFAENGLICVAIIMAMVTCATIPIFTFKTTAFTATR
ncbi:MAG: threonine/serine exporter family protein [Muribaculaceae bacterium]|nr:threonine/serine exporter family protein [Muribaculaceae bacterium]MDE6534323.1 threonine/serine exporter family protein [Muribaculaceae bacterium]MDE6772941.1 threonine/serine exporter family protein [Muribaculaceae bacterium]